MDLLSYSVLRTAVVSVKLYLHVNVVISMSFYYNTGEVLLLYLSHCIFILLLQVGFELVDAIAEAEGISMSTVSCKSLFGEGLFY